MLLCALTVTTTYGQSPDSPQTGIELQAVKLLRAQNPKEKEKLRAAYAELEAKYPLNTSIKEELGELLWDWDECDAAIEKWQAARKLAPDDARLLERLGEASLALGNIRSAADYFQRAATSAPDQASCHFSLANVLFLFRHELEFTENQAFERALFHFSEASRLAPENPEYARAYAEVFYGVPSPDWQAALLAWSHLKDLSSDKDFPNLNLARVHIILGQKDAAHHCLNQIHSDRYSHLKRLLQKRLEKTLQE